MKWVLLVAYLPQLILCGYGVIFVLMKKETLLELWWRWINRVAPVLVALGLGIAIAGQIFQAVCSPLFERCAWVYSLTITSWHWMHGYPMYPVASDIGRYAINYGPFVYLMQALGIACFGHPIHGAKLISVIMASLGLLGLLWVTIKQNKRLFWIPFGLIFFPLAIFGRAVFSNRPESLMLMGVVLAILAIESQVLWFVLGVLGIALVLNAKFHGILYVLPVLPCMIQKRGWQKTVLVLCCAVLINGFVFLMPGIDWAGYWTYIILTVNHGVVFDNVIPYIFWWVSLIIPMLMIRFRFHWVTIVSVALLTSSSLKMGTYSNVFGPFVPILVWELSRYLEHSTYDIKKKAGVMIGVLLFFCFVTSSFFFSAQVWGLIKRQDEFRQQKTELIHLFQAYQPKVPLVGYPSGNTFQAFGLYLPYTASSLLWTDEGVWLWALQNTSFKAQADCFKTHQFDVIFMPKGQPFGGSLSDFRCLDIFKQAFSDYYQCVARHQYFDVWIQK